MTVVPLPDVNTVRCRLIYNTVAAADAGQRFFLSYSGSAPTGANCTTLAGDIHSAWVTNIKPLVSGNYALVEIDVLDISTATGLSGQWTGDELGSRSGTNMPVQCAMDIEYGIARRYRGGKPRTYLPGGVESDQLAPNTWTTAFTSACQTGWAAFMSAVEASSVGSMGTLQHINLSYYSSFKNIANSSGRIRAVPQYKAVATHDNITGYFAKQLIGSQKRRRNSSTP